MCLSSAFKKFKEFSIADIAFFKLYLFSGGAIIGAYFADFVLGNIIIIGLVFGFSLVWILMKMCSCCCKKNK